MIEYPKDFRDWKNGVRVRDEKIKEWVKQIQREPKLTAISSGNTIVVQNGEDIIVARDYEMYDAEAHGYMND